MPMRSPSRARSQAQTLSIFLEATRPESRLLGKFRFLDRLVRDELVKPVYENLTSYLALRLITFIRWLCSAKLQVHRPIILGVH